jgi:hypothetical protein
MKQLAAAQTALSLCPVSHLRLALLRRIVAQAAHCSGILLLLALLVCRLLQRQLQQLTSQLKLAPVMLGKEAAAARSSPCWAPRSFTGLLWLEMAALAAAIVKVQNHRRQQQQQQQTCTAA